MTERYRLFALTTSAWRDGADDRPEVAMQTSGALIVGDDDPETGFYREAQVAFPEKDGWKDHCVSWFEFEQGSMLGPFRLTWDAEQEAVAV